MNKINILPPESIERENATTLELDPKHPGINDKTYVNRRTELFNLAREYRLSQKGFPWVNYTEEEHALWHLISSRLKPLHNEKASAIYLEGKERLNIDTEKMPQLAELSDKLYTMHNIQLVPAEGLISTRTFHYYLAQRAMPCTLFLRHTSNPYYTPEPDVVHDLTGHVPALINPLYVDLMQMIGKGVLQADDKQLIAWSRIYWFTIEFGLIEENHEIKILGAGLLSSYGEMEYCYSDKVIRKPFILEDVINQDYDHTRMQDILFIIPSLEFLYQEVKRLMSQFSASK